METFVIIITAESYHTKASLKFKSAFVPPSHANKTKSFACHCSNHKLQVIKGNTEIVVVNVFNSQYFTHRVIKHKIYRREGSKTSECSEVTFIYST